MTIQYADARTMERSMQQLPSRSRVRCDCGCNRRATHMGTVNGMGMTSGCELSIRRWVKRYSRW